MPLYIYLYEGKPLISGISGKPYAKTLHSMVAFCVFLCEGKKKRNTWGAADRGEKISYYLCNDIYLFLR